MSTPSSSPAFDPSAFTPSTPDLSDLVGGKPPKEPGSGSATKGALVAGGVLGGIVLLGAGFFVGHATAASGPKTLAEAVTQAQSGKLACGSTTGIVTRLCSTTGTGTGTGGYGGFGAGGAGGTGGGFAGGAAPSGAPGAGQGGTRGGGNAALADILGTGAVAGTVTSVDGTTLTLTTRGGAVTYTLPTTATLTKTTTGSLSDLLSGETVYVAATTDSAGKQTVSKIFLVPATTTGATPTATAAAG